MQVIKMLKNKVRNYRLERARTRSLEHKLEAELIDHGFLDRARPNYAGPHAGDAATVVRHLIVEAGFDPDAKPVCKSLDGIRR